MDEDGSDGSRRFVAGLQAEAGLSVGLKPGDENGPAGPLYTAASAEQAVRKGEVPVALIIPKGFGAQSDRVRSGRATRPKLAILADSADPDRPAGRRRPRPEGRDDLDARRRWRAAAWPRWTGGAAA